MNIWIYGVHLYYFILFSVGAYHLDIKFCFSVTSIVPSCLRWIPGVVYMHGPLRMDPSKLKSLWETDSLQICAQEDNSVVRLHVP